jgi:hypothetical protein
VMRADPVESPVRHESICEAPVTRGRSAP